MLKATGRILPSQFEFYLEPVCLKDDHRVPFLWENNPCGIDYGFLKNSKDIDKYKRDNYKRRSLQNKSIDYFLCKPDAILKFDLNELNYENDIPKVIDISKKIGMAISGTSKINSLLELVLHSIINALGASSGKLMLLDETENEFYTVASRGLNEDEKAQKLKSGEGFIGLAAKEARPLRLAGTDQSWAIGGEHKSVLCQPLVRNNQVMGLLVLYDKKEDKEFTED